MSFRADRASRGGPALRGRRLRPSSRALLLAIALAAVSGCSLSSGGIRTRVAAGDSRTIQFKVDEWTVLRGLLTIPPGSGPFPAVILLHGCEGLPSGAVSGWRTALTTWGYATFEVDSFGGRKLSTTCGNPSALWFAERVPDVYRALKILATHPRIAADRIALMGWSDGGTTTLRGAALSMVQRHAAPSEPRFKAFFAFYPGCSVFFESGQMSQPVRSSMTKLSMPVRIHAGKLDSRTPALPCEALARALSENGNDIGITVYEDARHSFDNAELARREPSPGRDLPVVDAHRGGADRKDEQAEWNARATADARTNVRDQLTRLLGPPGGASANQAARPQTDPSSRTPR